MIVTACDVFTLASVMTPLIILASRLIYFTHLLQSAIISILVSLPAMLMSLNESEFQLLAAKQNIARKCGGEKKYANRYAKNSLISLYPAPLLLLMILVLVTGDETYQDIFQDFTHMASNDPDKLNRYQQ